VSFAHEPADLELHWRNFTQGQRSSPKIWTDAYLAAFAQAGGYGLATFDKGFTQYQGLKAIILP
jgi:predicted nucleic acid-binding protein